MISWFKSLFKEQEEQKKEDVFVPPETRIEVIAQRNGKFIYSPQVRYRGGKLCCTDKLITIT